MASMKQFLEKRKKTVQEETVKFRVEYEAVISYLNSTMQKAEANCRELTDESDYDQFRKKCVPSLNWLQEQYDVILLMRSLCLPGTTSELESESDPCPELPVQNQAKPTEILPVANQARPTEILPVANEDRPTEILPALNRDEPTKTLPVANENIPTEIPASNRDRPTEILPVLPQEIPLVQNQVRPTEIPLVQNQVRPTEIPLVQNQVRPTEIPLVQNQVRPTEIPLVQNQDRPTEAPIVQNQGKPKEIPLVQTQGKPTDIPLVQNEDRPTEIPLVQNKDRPTEILLAQSQGKPKEIPIVQNQGKPKEIQPVQNQGKPKEIQPVQNQGKTKEIPLVQNQGKTKEIPIVENQVRPKEIQPVQNQGRPTEIPLVQNQERPTEILLAQSQGRQSEILPGLLNQYRPAEILPDQNECRPAEMKEHGDEGSLYESATSDVSDCNGKPCLVSSLRVNSPYLPPYPAGDVVSPAPDAEVQNSTRSAADSVVSSLDSESGRTKRCLEVTSAIPKFKICESTLEVMATMVISPFLIWVQVKPRTCALEDLLEELTSYHRKLKLGDVDFRLPSKPQVGQLVSAQFTQDDMWYRGYVLAVFDLPSKSGLPGKKRKEMDIAYADYGNSERLPLSRVRPLPEKFRKLPLQAFLCALSEIGPATPTGFLQWSDDILASFNQMDCTQLLTVRFSKPLPGCPIMFIEILNSKHLGSSKDGTVSTENILTERMILNGQAVRMPDNTHVARWYREMYAKNIQPVNPGEKLAASLTYADGHYANMPILDVRDVHAGKSSSNNDGSQHRLKNPSSAMSSANSGHPWLTKRKTTSSHTLGQGQPSVHDCQPSLPKVDLLQQSVNDVQIESQKKVDCGRKRSNKSQTLLRNDDAINQSVLNVCHANQPKCSNAENHQKLETVSSEVRNDFWNDSYCGGAEGVVVPSSDHLKVWLQSRMESGNSSGFMIADCGQKNVSGLDQTTWFDIFMNAAQSSVASSTLPELSSSGIGLNSCGKKDSVADSHRRVKRNDSRNSFQRSVEGVPLSVEGVPLSVKGVPLSVDGPDYSGSTLSRPPSSSCSLQDQKFNETKAYVEALASSGWPEKIARDAMRHNEDESGDGYPEDLAISPPVVDVARSPWKSEFGEAAGNTDIHEADRNKNLVQDSKQEQVQKSEENLAQKPEQTDVKQCAHEQPEQTEVKQCGHEQPKQTEVKHCGHEQPEQGLTWTVSHVVVPSEGFIRVVMSHLESPSRFWVHLINEDAYIIDYIGDELKRHYTDVTMPGDTETLKNDKVLHDYGLCCACSSVDCQLYRAEVISISKNQKCEIKVRVFYVDFGNSEWIDAAQMLPLPPGLLSIPPLAIRCSLDDLEPVPVSGEPCHWSQEAIDVFTDLCGFTRELHGRFRSQVKPGDAFYVSRDRPLRLRLEIPDEEYPEDINEQLMMRYLAKPSEKRQPTTTREEPAIQPGMKDEMDGWDPMAEDFLSHRNSYKVDIDDPGVAMVNYKAQDERRICKFFRSKNSRCWRGENCPYEHIAFEGIVTTTDRREVFSVCDDEFQLELPSVGSWVIVNVTCVIDPGHFFVVLPFGTRSLSENPLEEKKLVAGSLHDEGYDDRIPSPSSNSHDSLEYLMDCLQEFYRSKVYTDNDLTVYAEGEVVVARFTQDERWHRAKIITSDPDNNQVQVLYVDFGNKEWVDNERIRQMDAEFLYLPFQAVECRLPLCANNNSGKTWSDMAKKLFLDLTRAQFLVARVVQRGPGVLLYVELFNTKDGDVNINKTLLTKGCARKPDRMLIPRSPCLKTSSPKQGRGSTFKDRWALLPG